MGFDYRTLSSISPSVLEQYLQHRGWEYTGEVFIDGLYFSHWKQSWHHTNILTEYPHAEYVYFAADAVREIAAHEGRSEQDILGDMLQTAV